MNTLRQQIKDNNLSMLSVANKLEITVQGLYFWCKQEKVPRYKAVAVEWAIMELTSKQ